MLAYIHHSNTVIIVLHEIDSIAPNLLNGRESFCYDQEAIAYNYFMNSVGFE
ncbi:hypothetical protein SPSIL_000520 [Sporomusa silvacetica DSM 10669]|uniref:Uncharacterized protein n=1 Tax=Sporomusa silvacetica DSM 10669 TaxID=1123289 RepID=A0ABZ3IE57_9FIRM|nr:hypothetical protein SPSIL_05210 [Sporomusa silvacetica DSM 10669]